MTTDIDIYRAASLLIRDHGDEAVIEAAMRADQMLEQGDLDGLAVWKRILAAVGDGQPGIRLCSWPSFHVFWTKSGQINADKNLTN